MFYVRCDSYEGLPSQLYRTPEEIGRDIAEVRKRIDSIGEKLNVRNILAEALSDIAEDNPTKWIPELEGVVRETMESLGVLRGLNDTLDSLMAELEETKCILRI